MNHMKSISTVFLIATVASILGLPFWAMSQNSGRGPARDFDDVIQRNASQFIEQGRQIFRFDTFGDEAFWGNALKLHQAIAGSRFGGVGPGVSPRTALAVGLKVDSEALPSDLADAIRRGRVDLDDPANTLALLRLNAVVGVTGFFDQRGVIRSIGIQCALAIQRSTIHLRQELAGDWMDGPVAISTLARLCRSRRTYRPCRTCWVSIKPPFALCLRVGDQASSTPRCFSMAKPSAMMERQLPL